jgi:hypothetical protein
MFTEIILAHHAVVSIAETDCRIQHGTDVLQRRYRGKEPGRSRVSSCMCCRDAPLLRQRSGISRISYRDDPTAVVVVDLAPIITMPALHLGHAFVANRTDPDAIHHQRLGRHFGNGSADPGQIGIMIGTVAGQICRRLILPLQPWPGLRAAPVRCGGIRPPRRPAYQASAGSVRCGAWRSTNTWSGVPTPAVR